MYFPFFYYMTCTLACVRLHFFFLYRHFVVGANCVSQGRIWALGSPGLGPRSIGKPLTNFSKILEPREHSPCLGPDRPGLRAHHAITTGCSLRERNRNPRPKLALAPIGRNHMFLFYPQLFVCSLIVNLDLIPRPKRA
jgi:hypothetical protein